MTDRSENRPETAAEPATVSSELRYAFTGGQVLRQESGRQAEVNWTPDLGPLVKV